MKKYKVIKSFFISSAGDTRESGLRMTEVSFVRKGSVYKYHGGDNEAPEGYYNTQLGFKLIRFSVDIVENNSEYFELV